ncbi:hypothetical protein [Clostridium chrysemydis]|uniref:hypothetical protein n=1 Tax=Clostridium chrysemydis TaxID=2665504 RepID=UPI0018839774|nr:hypothetical protein [Clostridium chrysemydis]
MNPEQIIEDMKQQLAALTRGNDMLKTLSLKKNKAEQIYRMALARKMLVLRAEKHPVSIVHDLARGDEKIAQLRLDRDVAESSYFTCKSEMDNLRLKIEVNRSLLKWNGVELKNL